VISFPLHITCVLLEIMELLFEELLLDILENLAVIMSKCE